MVHYSAKLWISGHLKKNHINNICSFYLWLGLVHHYLLTVKVLNQSKGAFHQSHWFQSLTI